MFKKNWLRLLEQWEKRKMQIRLIAKSIVRHAQRSENEIGTFESANSLLALPVSKSLIADGVAVLFASHQEHSAQQQHPLPWHL